MQRKAGRWSFITGEKGRNRVRVFAHPDTGRLFLELRENGAKRRIALGHRDREAAKLKAEEVAAALRRPNRVFQPTSRSARSLTITYGR
jgi:hypothetical protein